MAPLLNELVATLVTSGARALTGARAIWQGCAPEPGQRVYYANHSSHGDFVLIWASLPRALRAVTRPVAGADYWERSAARAYLIHKVFRGVLVQRDRSLRGDDPVEIMAQALDQGDSLIIFPEGTRNMEEDLLPFKSGIYHLARARPQIEFVPVWIENLNRVLPKGALVPVPLLCKLTFGTPQRLTAEESKDHFLKRTRGALLALAPAQN